MASAKTHQEGYKFQLDDIILANSKIEKIMDEKQTSQEQNANQSAHQADGTCVAEENIYTVKCLKPLGELEVEKNKDS